MKSFIEIRGTFSSEFNVRGKVNHKLFKLFRVFRRLESFEWDTHQFILGPNIS